MQETRSLKFTERFVRLIIRMICGEPDMLANSRSKALAALLAKTEVPR